MGGVLSMVLDLGIGHWALGIGHWALGKTVPSSEFRVVSKEMGFPTGHWHSLISLIPMPHAHQADRHSKSTVFELL